MLLYISLEMLPHNYNMIYVYFQLNLLSIYTIQILLITLYGLVFIHWNNNFVYAFRAEILRKRLLSPKQLLPCPLGTMT